MHFAGKSQTVNIHLIINQKFEGTAPVRKAGLSCNYTGVFQDIVCAVSSVFISESYDGSLIPTVSEIRWPLSVTIHFSDHCIT